VNSTVSAIAATLAALCSAVTCADPPSGPGSIEDAVRSTDALRKNGMKVAVVYPIFHQIVALSFPKGFAPSFEQTRGPSYIQESVLLGETVEKWSQMITVTGAQGAAMKPELTPDRWTDFFVAGYQKVCPGTFSGSHLPAGELTSYSAVVVLVGCGTVTGHGSDHSEAMLLVTLKGDQDYYTVQWAERGPATPAALEFDAKTWGDRLLQLQPIRVCPRVPGEAPPFPSCITPK
jgi:hypothetical protein